MKDSVPVVGFAAVEREERPRTTFQRRLPFYFLKVSFSLSRAWMIKRGGGC